MICCCVLNAASFSNCSLSYTALSLNYLPKRIYLQIPWVYQCLLYQRSLSLLLSYCPFLKTLNYDQCPLCPFIQVVDEDIEQDWTQPWLLGDIVSYRPPAKACTTTDNPLSSVIQAVLNPSSSYLLQCLEPLHIVLAREHLHSSSVGLEHIPAGMILLLYSQHFVWRK